MTRRGFLGRLGVAGTGALAAGCEIEDVVRLVDDVRSDVRIGVVANSEITWPDSTGNLRKAFAYFRQEGASAVVIAGKATQRGYKNQFEVLHAAYASVYGHHPRVPLILEPGRHEVKGFAFGVSAGRPFEPCEVLTFHGTGKRELTNELLFHDAENHAVYAGTIGGIVLQAGYEREGSVFDGKSSVSAAQGLLVSVYSSSIVVRRLDFSQNALPDGKRPYWPVYAEEIAAPLVLDRATLAPKDAPPASVAEFGPNASLRLVAGDKNGRRVLTVTWPNLLVRTGAAVRANRYELGLHVAAEGETRLHAPISRRYVLTSGFYLSEVRDSAFVTCTYEWRKIAEFQRGGNALLLSVTPVSVWGARGKPLTAPLISGGGA